MGRADSEHEIEIGYSSNVQDGAVITTLPESATLETGFPPITYIGHYVSVGAGSVLVSCRIDDLVLIGDKCTILEGCLVESHTILEPGTVVLPFTRIPSGQKWGGNPAKYICDLNPEEMSSIKDEAEKTFEQAWEHLREFLPVGNTYLHLEELEQKGVDVQQG